MAAAEPGTRASGSSSRRLAKGIALEREPLEGRPLRVWFIAVCSVPQTVLGTWWVLIIYL